MHNWKRFLVIIVVVAAILGVAQAFIVRAAPAETGDLAPFVVTSSRHDTSVPLRLQPQQAERGTMEKVEESESDFSFRVLPKASNNQASKPTDLYSILQSSPGIADAMPLPIHNFEGVNNVDGVLPPDTNGDVGFDSSTGTKYYMQWVNLSLQIWDVTDPNNVTSLWGPVDGNVLFDGFGGACETTNDGDPIVLFDQFENRWVAGQFALPNFPAAPFYQCMAVSATADPTGAWHRYEFEWPVPKMNDYPKLGVWTDGIYITANQFANNATSWGGAGVGAFDKMAMYSGNAAEFVFFDLFDVNSNFGGMLPADLDGAAPPAGTPNFFAEWDDSAWLGDAADTIRIWEFDVDWNNPANSTFGLAGLPNDQVTTTDVDPDMCGFARNCIPLPGGSAVDAISDRMMFRLAYRYHQGQHVLVSNHTVDVGGDQAGVHWFDLRSDGNMWTMHQEGVYAPDSDHRWMASTAMDYVGNLAVGFSVASPTTFPSVRYAGRLAADPLGQLTQGEAEIIEGAGYQEHSAGRWGDYSSLNIDPTDDCTFWYTQEYYGSIGSAPWQTRVGSFKFPSCTQGPQGWLNGTVTDGNGDPLAGARVEAMISMTQTVATATNANGMYTMTLPVGTVDATASLYGYLAETVAGLTISPDNVTTQDFSLAEATFYTVDGYVRDANTGWPLYAALQINGYPGDPIWTDPVTGYYSVMLAEGITYTIHADAWTDGYTPDTVTLPDLSSDESADLYLDVDANLCTAPGYYPVYDWYEDFESGDGGFTEGGTNSSWAFGMPTSGPGAAHSGDNLWATNLDGNYNNSEESMMTSPVIDLSGYAGRQILLAWWQWFDAESGWDYISVEVSDDAGTSWAPVYGPISGTEQEWEQQVVVLDSSYAVADFQFRFFLDSDSTVTRLGWYVDDIGLVAGPAEPPLIMIEDFEADDGGYTVGGTLPTWEWGMPTNGPAAAYSGDYLWATNLDGNYANDEESMITSPAMDLSAYAGQELSLSWWQWYNVENTYDTIHAEATSDGGATWTTIYGPYDGSGATESVWQRQWATLDASYAVADFQVRFHMTGDFTVNYEGWYVDDVGVYEALQPPTIACVPAAGGLVVGFVSDENTGMPLPDATVYHDQDQIDTGYTPDDHDQSDGFYTIWAPPGQQVLTATLMNSFYGIDVNNVTVVQSSTVQQDFELPAAWVTHTPDGISAVLNMGESDTSQLTLENIGGMSTPWETTELDEGREILMPFDPLPDVMVRSFRTNFASAEGLKLPPGPEAAPLAAGDILQSWIPTESLPNPWSIAYDANNDSVWVGEGWGNDIIWEYSPDGTFTGRSYDFPWAPVNGPADTAYNWNTGMIWILNVDTGNSNCIYEIDPDSGFTGNIICPGGGTGFATSQRGLTYDPASDTFFAGGWNDFMVYRFATDGTMLEQVNTGLAIAGLAYNPDTMHLFVMTNADPNMVYVLDVADNYTIVGSFLPDQGFAGFAGGGLEFDCDGNLWAVDIDTGTVFQMESGEEAVFCDRDVPWVTSTPVTGTLNVAGSAVIDVTLDASVVDQPGDYHAFLKVTTETPYDDLYVPLTMTVPAPASWGKLDGYIEGLGRCDADLDQMLQDATIYVEASNGVTTTVSTDSSGYFEWWMDAAPSSPVEITVSYPGYVDQTIGGISLQAGASSSQMVDLRLDAPCASSAPDSVTVTLVQGMTETRYLTVTNSGAGSLDYRVLETERTLPYGPVPAASQPTFSAAAPLGPSSVRLLADNDRAVAVEAPESDWYGALDLPGGITRYGHAQCFEAPDSFYVIGGVDEAFSLSDKTWRYDGDSNSWTELAPIPVGSEGPAAVCYWGKIYVMGGDGTNSFYIYDIAADEWMSGPPLPRNVAGAAAGAWDGLIYLAGGDDDFTPSTGVSDEINQFDIALGQWDTLTSTLPAGTSFPGYHQLDNDLYVVGGWGDLAPTESVTYTARINLTDGNVTTGPTFNSARSDFALGATNEALYAIGGDADGGGFFDSVQLVERLDLSTWPNGSWLDTNDPLPVPRSGNNAGYCTGAVFGAELHSVGGFDPNTGAVTGDNRFLAAPGESCFSVYDDVPWLEPQWLQSTVAHDSSEMIPVVFDATGLAPGTYDATLLLVNNDPPMAQEFAIPVTLEVVEAVQTVAATVDAPNKATTPGGMVTYLVTMTNTGNLPLTLHLEAGAHQWSMIMPDHTATLQPGESDVMQVQVYVPADAQPGDDDVVEVMVMMDDTQMASVNLTTTAVAEEEHAVMLSPLAASGSDAPGMTVAYTLTVTNNGNLTDTFDLTLSGDTWTTAVSMDSVTLGAGEMAEVTVTVEIPAGAPVGAYDVALLTATSQGDPTKSISASMYTSATAGTGMGYTIFLPTILNE